MEEVEFFDALVFSSITPKWNSVFNIIIRADFVGRGGPGNKALNHALNLLLHNGLIEQDKHRYRLSPKGESSFRNTSARELAQVLLLKREMEEANLEEPDEIKELVAPEYHNLMSLTGMVGIFASIPFVATQAWYEETFGKKRRK